MKVQKRDGTCEIVSFDKVLRRIQKLSEDLTINSHEIAQKICHRIFDGVKTSELDELTAQLCSSLIADNPDYDKLASRILISNHQKKTSPSFSETIDLLYNNDFKLVSDEVYNIVQMHKNKLNNYIDYQRDFLFDFFGFKTLERAYLMKNGDRIVERPQHMFMRVAIGIHGYDIKDVLETYDAMSQKMFLHATPTLFNYGTPREQGSSCFLLHMNDDSIKGIYDSLSECAAISKYAGGIGMHIHNIRGKNSVIRGTNGKSDGIIPMLRVFNSTALYVNQCFTPETIVYTETGPKRISSVRVGDKVYTKDNSLKRVNEVIVNNIDKKILKIKTSCGLDPVYVTREHKIYIYGRGFIDAGDLAVGDRTVYPKSKTELEMRDKFVTYDYDEAQKKVHELFVYGMLAACTQTTHGFEIEVCEQEEDDFNIDTIVLIEEVIYKGSVYDLNIEDNHNYVVGNLGLVHNSGKRNGSIAIYLEPWHCDVEKFLDMRKNHGNEEERARDLFYALWIPDLFMERVRNNEMWSLMCPDECKGLSDVYGEKFEELYTEYENAGHFRKQVKAQDLWIKILESQMETGTPYMLYKDNVNKKSNQQNLGTIKSSNLCVEIMEYTSPDEIAVCNLASLCLPNYVENGVFNYEKLGFYTRILCKNLNKIIDKNYYPVEKARVSNLKHRPIGIGVQGLCDTYMILKIAYDSDEAKQLNKQIFETIYYYAMSMSIDIAKKRDICISNGDDEYELKINEYEKNLLKYKGAYSSFDGSPLSRGIFQFDMWGVKPSMYDWESLRENVLKYGARNSLLLAPMPTASTSQIMGYTESFEIMTSNIYKRKTLAGEFIIINKYLINDLIKANLWNKEMKDEILIREGSIQSIEAIPIEIRNLYKTAWDIKQKHYIDQCIDRGAFICQSQSMNLFIDDPSFHKLNTIHFYTWSSGLKTGMYYLRTKPKANTQQFTIDPTKAKSNIVQETVCESCSA